MAFDFGSLSLAVVKERTDYLDARSEGGDSRVNMDTVEIRDLGNTGFTTGELICLTETVARDVIVGRTGHKAPAFICLSSKKASADLFLSQLVRSLTMCTAEGKPLTNGGVDNEGHLMAQGSAVDAWKQHKKATDGVKEFMKDPTDPSKGFKTIYVYRHAPKDLVVRFDNATGKRAAGTQALYDFWFVNEDDEPINKAGQVIEYDERGAFKVKA